MIPLDAFPALIASLNFLTGCLLLALVAWQVFLGGLTIWTQKAVIPTTAHVLSGALVLATALVLAIRAYRILVPVPGPAGAPGAAAAA